MSKTTSRDLTIVAIGSAARAGVGPIPLAGFALRDAQELERDGLLRRTGDEWTLTDAGAAAFTRIQRERGL